MAIPIPIPIAAMVKVVMFQTAATRKEPPSQGHPEPQRLAEPLG